MKSVIIALKAALNDKLSEQVKTKYCTKIMKLTTEKNKVENLFAVRFVQSRKGQELSIAH